MSQQGDRLDVIPLAERRRLREIIDRLNRVVDDLERLATQEEADRHAASRAEREHARNGRPKEHPDRGP